MQPLTERKIVLVFRQTRLVELVRRFNTIQQAQFYVEHLGADFSDYLAEDSRYAQALAAAAATLATYGRVQRLDRAFVPNFIFGPDDIVVVIGQDGLVANTLKYLDGQSVIGINPDPQRWDGRLLPFGVEDLALILPDVLRGRRPVNSVTMAEAVLNSGERLYAVNDLFIGPQSHTSARYSLRIGDRFERQSSSGVIVSTGLGSTGWLASIYAGWQSTSAHLAPSARLPEGDGHFEWSAARLTFYVREPFPSRSSAASLVIGDIHRGEALTLVSEMPERGVIFSDGLESDFLDFNSGTVATIRVADRRGQLVA